MRRPPLFGQIAARNVACQRRPCAKTRAPRWATFRPSGVLAVGAHRSPVTDPLIKCCRETTSRQRSGRRVEGHIAERELLRSNVAFNAACRCAPMVSLNPTNTTTNQRTPLYPTQKDTRRAAGFFLTSPGRGGGILLSPPNTLPASTSAPDESHTAAP